MTSTLNDAVAPLVADLVRQAEHLRIGIAEGANGETIVDMGIEARGSIAAGLAASAIAMGGLGRVTLGPSGHGPALPWSVVVASSQPALACLASQYAGWHLHQAAGDDPYEGLGSGPARALAAREPIFASLGYREQASVGTLLVESERAPPPTIVAAIAEACGLHPSRLTLILVPSESIAGAVQIAARGLEAAIGRAHKADFPLSDIVDGLASVPLAPPHPDRGIAMGRSNDAMIYGGQVQLFVTGPADRARALAAFLPSCTAPDHGRSFADILADAGGAFYRIDGRLFGPAAVSVTALDSGETFRAGALDLAMVKRSFGVDPEGDG